MRIVVPMDDLFAIDAEAREEHGPRRASRAAPAEGACAAGRNPAQILEARRTALPPSARARPPLHAGLWSKLTRFLEYPELELSNNLAENSMRPIAIGRKNWIHIGSASGRTQGRRDPLGRRELPSKEDPGARIPGRSAAGSQQLLHPSRSRTHSQSLGRKTQSARLITPTQPSTVCLLSRLPHRRDVVSIWTANTRAPTTQPCSRSSA